MTLQTDLRCDIAGLLQFFRINGYAVFEGFASPEKMDWLLAEHAPILRAKIAAAGVPARRMNLRPGSLLALDPRVLHRGTPNYTDRPQPLAGMAYHLPEFPDKSPELTRADFEQLSERGKQLLRTCRIVESR